MRRGASTLPTRFGNGVAPSISSPRLVDRWQFQAVRSPSCEWVPQADSEEDYTMVSASAPSLHKMQALLQEMLNSETGVPIRSQRHRLTVIPSVFTGSDIINWITKRLHCETKEAIHVANMLYKHGYFFAIEGGDRLVRDDHCLYRYQTPHLWLSQNSKNNDTEYAVYLCKMWQRSKNKMRLASYEIENLQKLQVKLRSDWTAISSRATDEVRILKEQKKVARALIESQERAFWRLKRPPPTRSCVHDYLLTVLGTKSYVFSEAEATAQDVQNDIAVLNKTLTTRILNLSTTLEGLINYSQKYSTFDPFLHLPSPSNPWVTNDETLWIFRESLLECPSEWQVKRWACCLSDLLNDVNGRYRFDQFCKKQCCDENIKFWQACRDLKMLPLASVHGSVQLIFDEFIDPSARTMVNLSAEAFEEAQKDLEQPSRYSFSLAQAQVYSLMNSDIYPRYLKSEEYHNLLKMLPGGGSVGKSFLKKFIPKTKSNPSMAKVSMPPLPLKAVSPCHYHRYTKRHLSISRRMSSNNSASLDNIFLSVSEDGSNCDAFVDSLVSPNKHSRKLNLTSPVTEMTKSRRTSAPIMPNLTAPQRLASPVVNELSLSNSSSARTPEGDTASGILWMVSEGEEDESLDTTNMRSHSGPPRPYTDSLDDLSSLTCNQAKSHLPLRGHYVGSLGSTAAGLYFDQLHLDRKKSLSVENLANLTSPDSVSSLPVPTLLTPVEHIEEEGTFSMVGAENGGHPVAPCQAFTTQDSSTVDSQGHYTYLNSGNYSPQAVAN